MSNTIIGNLLKTKFESTSTEVKPRVGLVLNFDWDGPQLVFVSKITRDEIILGKLVLAKPEDENVMAIHPDEIEDTFEDVNTGKVVKAKDLKQFNVYSTDWDGQSIVVINNLADDEVEFNRLHKAKGDENTLAVDKDEFISELKSSKGNAITFKAGRR